MPIPAQVGAFGGVPSRMSLPPFDHRAERQPWLRLTREISVPHLIFGRAYAMTNETGQFVNKVPSNRVGRLRNSFDKRRRNSCAKPLLICAFRLDGPLGVLQGLDARMLGEPESPALDSYTRSFRLPLRRQSGRIHS